MSPNRSFTSVHYYSMAPAHDSSHIPVLFYCSELSPCCKASENTSSQKHSTCPESEYISSKIYRAGDTIEDLPHTVGQCDLFDINHCSFPLPFLPSQVSSSPCRCLLPFSHCISLFLTNLQTHQSHSCPTSFSSAWAAPVATSAGFCSCWG